MMFTAGISDVRMLIPAFTALPVRAHAHLLASCAEFASSGLRGIFGHGLLHADSL